MPIPDFQSLMLPIMKIAEDSEEHRDHELRQRIGEQLGLTDDTTVEEILRISLNPVEGIK